MIGLDRVEEFAKSSRLFAQLWPESADFGRVHVPDTAKLQRSREEGRMTCVPRGIAALLGQGLARRPLYMAADTQASGRMGSPFSRRRVVLMSLLALAGTTLGLRDAAAHSRLVKSDPATRAVVATAPKEIKLWFNEQVEPAFAQIWLAPSEGEKIPLASRGDPSDKRLLVATLPDNLPEGPIVIGFHVLSVDGHTIEDKLSFTIKKPT
jgi:methionine-rich copper-binding protein CopC